MSAIKRSKGSIIIAALIVALITGALVGAFLKTISQEIRDSHRSRMALQCINLAEAGIEFAIDAIHRNDWSGWEAGSKGYFRKEFPFTSNTWNPDNRSVSVYAEPHASLPRIVAEGVIRSRTGIEVNRQVMVELGTRSLFASGLVAKNSVVFSGNNVYIDSYRSSRGPYHGSLNADDNGSVATVSVVSDAINLGNGNVWGRVATGGGRPNVGPNGSIRGRDTPSGVKVDNDRVALDFYAELPDPVMPELSSPLTSYSGNVLGISGTSSTYLINSLKLSGNSVLSIQGDVTLVLNNDFGISGNAQLRLEPGSSLTIYAKGEFDATGNGIVNRNNDPATLLIYGMEAGEDVKVAGNGGFFGMIYAPNSEITVVGNGEMYGAVVGNNIKFTGNAKFHYDEDLADFGDDGIRRVTRWLELTQAADKVQMSSILSDGF